MGENTEPGRRRSVVTDTGPFAMVPVWLLDSGVSHRAVYLYAILAAYADYETGVANPRRKTLAQRMGVSLPTVDKAIAELVAAEALTVEAQTDDLGDRAPNLYTVRRSLPGRKAGLATGRKAGFTSENENHRERETATDVAVRDGGRKAPDGWKVDRVVVTWDEKGLAEQILAEWNQQTGQSLQSRDWLAKFVMRVREHPDLTIEDHAFVIHRALENPWWKGPASPSVVYGNGAQFERSIVAAQKDADPRGKVLTSADIRAMADEAERRGL